MFRKMRRSGQQVSADECRRVLKEAGRGVLSVNGDDGYPYGMPVNFYYDEAEDAVYIHGAMRGHRADSIRRSDKVCFTVWDDGYREEGDWAWYVTSVIVFGRAEPVDDTGSVMDKVRALGMKYYPTAGEVEDGIREDVGKVQVVRIRVESMTGKLIHEK